MCQTSAVPVRKTKHIEDDELLFAAYLKSLSLSVLTPPDQEADTELTAEFMEMSAAYVRQYPDTADAYLCNAFREIIELKSARSLLDVERRNANALHSFEEGIQQHPDDHNLRVAFANYMTYLPKTDEMPIFDYEQLLQPVLNDLEFSQEIRRRLETIYG